MSQHFQVSTQVQRDVSMIFANWEIRGNGDT